MTLLYMRLDVGFATGDLTAVASMVQRWVRQQLESCDDLELGGHYLSYVPTPLPEVGLCGVRVLENHTEGISGSSWRLPHRPDLATCVEVEVCGPDLLELGRLAARGRTVCGDLLSVAAYVVTRSPVDLEDPVFPGAHIVRFGANGQPGTEFPELLCYLSCGFETGDLTTAGSIAGRLLQSPAVEHESEDLGGRYLVLAGGATRGLVRSNQISLVKWLYPRHKNHRLLLDVTRQTPSLLELGELALQVEESFPEQLSVIGHRVAGDLVRDRVPRLFSYERERGST